MLTKNKLKTFAPFSAFDDVFLSEALATVHVATAKKGAIIFKRGKSLADQFFLLEGEVHLINNEYGSERVSSQDARALEPLNLHSPTGVSAIAKTPIVYFTINRADLEQLSRGRITAPMMDEPEAGEDCYEFLVSDLADDGDWMSCLLKSPLFNRLPSAQLQELFVKFETIEVEKGDVVVKEGAKGDYFYVMAAGFAHISDRSGAIDVTVREGQYFGEEALISRAPRNASVVMMSPGVLKRLNWEDFSQLVKAPVLQYLDANGLSSIGRPYKVLDVRMPIEYRGDHFPGSINVPLSKLRTSLPELAHTNAYAVRDDGAGRADVAAYLLCQAGFEAFVLTHADTANNAMAS